MNYNWNWSIFSAEVATGGETYAAWLVSGLGWTVATSLAAWVLAMGAGVVVGVLRTVPNPGMRAITAAYVEIFRNIPLIVQLFLWFFVFPEVLPREASLWVKQTMPLPEFITAVVGLGFFTSARIAEQVKAGILAIPRGQASAAAALGLTPGQTYRLVLLPIAFRTILPPLTSEFMNVFKNSSVALTIGLLELTAQARQMNEYTFQGFETFTAATLLYIGVALIANRVMHHLEERTRLPGSMGGEH